MGPRMPERLPALSRVGLPAGMFSPEINPATVSGLTVSKRPIGVIAMRRQRATADGPALTTIFRAPRHPPERQQVA